MRSDSAPQAIRGAAAPGFTLVEVLVALAIVAIALIAAAQASASLARNALRQADVVLAHVCAENALIRTRLARQLPDIGDSSATCEQAGRALEVTVTVRPTPNPNFRRVDAQVAADRSPVLRLSTIVGRF